MHCVTDAELLQFLSDETSGDESQRISSHLAACPRCQSVAERLTDDAELRACLGTPADETGVGGSADALDFMEPPIAPGELGVLGPYRVQEVLGRGGMGLVLKAFDTRLERHVAIKVPHSDQLVSSDAFLNEARLAAGLEHAHILPVHDFGETRGRCYVVSRFIQGTDLRQRLATGPMSPTAAAELAYRVADALRYAHRHDVFHRDVSPANILVDEEGCPYLSDFGLAVREKQRGPARGYLLGTLPYASPEQICGEGHRVDGRSDIYSLGAVLYESLCGRPPRTSVSRSNLIENALTFEPRPPRQILDTIPAELERVCLKCLSKRMVDRYPSAEDLCGDLQKWLSLSAGETAPPIRTNAKDVEPNAASPADTRSLSDQPTVIPKGLRSFDEHDASFFLQLLPGPRDASGLPGSVRFWKTQIEQTRADRAFSVGVIYGPSGCGKSSLVRAGLIPSLSSDITRVYVEAAGDDTEKRLLARLRSCIEGLSEHQTLAAAMAEIRRGGVEPGGRKLLVVIDQFEQWLHVNRDPQDTELVLALRQCDGARVQCVLLVRDDFWMALTRFTRELEVPLVEGGNSASVDLFSKRHAVHVLHAFGRSLDALPNAPTSEQRQFLTDAVDALAVDGQVTCVRLALFAEMMKNRPWTRGELRGVGGAEGLVAAFLEGTFSASTAPPQHRVHAPAARRLLKAMLPEPGSDIRTHRCADAELQQAADYMDRPRDYAELIRILDGEIRLITPTEGEAVDESSDAQARYYQLTHDYLVRPLRDWLSQKQRSTRRGRAELTLQDRAAQWTKRRENRWLPSMTEFFRIVTLTSRRARTAEQQQMMRRATRVHGLKLACLVLVLSVTAGLLYSFSRRQRANEIVDRVLNAEDRVVGTELERLQVADDRALAEAFRNAVSSTERSESQRMRARLALLAVDPSQEPILFDHLLQEEVTPTDIHLVSTALKRTKPGRRAIQSLWTVAREDPDSRRRFQATQALAVLDPPTSRGGSGWDTTTETIAAFVVDQLLSHALVNRTHVEPLAKTFGPTAELLGPELGRSYESPDRLQRHFATLYQVQFFGDDPERMAELALEAEPDQLRVLRGVLEQSRDNILAKTLTALREEPGPLDGLSPVDRQETLDQVALRRANAAIVRLLLQASDPALAWSQMRRVDDDADGSLSLRVRTYLTDRLQPSGVPRADVVDRLGIESNPSARKALILALGAYSSEDADDLKGSLLSMYHKDPDPGVHSAVEWLLRQWNVDPLSEQHQPPRGLDPSRRWYHGANGHRFAVVPRGVKYIRGASPRTEPRYNSSEEMHAVEFESGFAISTTEVTIEQFNAFMIARGNPPISRKFEGKELDPRCAFLHVSWIGAMQYCRWLSVQEGLIGMDDGLDLACYPPRDDIDANTRVALDKPGYRLPTEAEWEYICRAESTTPRFYGYDLRLLDRFAWTMSNSGGRVHPPGRLWPNDFGMFDIYGNAGEWCQNFGEEKKTTGPLHMPDYRFAGYKDRAWRGHTLNSAPTNLIRSANREHNPMETNIHSLGFRIARTLVPSSLP